MGKQIFKPYRQTGLQLPALETLIPESHLAHTVNAFVESLKLDFERLYKGGGSSAYSPKMLLKILLYAYSTGNYSSRQIMTSCCENIVFMWLSGLQYPDYRTINNFRNLIKELFPDIFDSLLKHLRSGGFISLEKYFVDGTKIEANAHKHSYVWQKNVQRYKVQHKEQIQKMLEEVEHLNSEPETPKVKKKRKKLLKSIATRQQKYDEYCRQERLLEGRRSFSKTDPSATFMRLKDERLRPCYNVLIGSENQFILNYSVHQKSTESGFLIEHLEQSFFTPFAVVGDAAFGSEQNHAYLEKKGIASYLKDTHFFQESKRSFKKKIFRKQNFPYDASDDTYICPAQRKLHFVQERTHRNAQGYPSTSRVYKSIDCEGCQVSSECKRGEGPRQIQISLEFERLKQNARQRLNSSKGFNLRRQRNTDVETVFGNIKQNLKFQRFNLRGIEKVKLEFGLVAMGHNLRKLAKFTGGGPFLFVCTLFFLAYSLKPTKKGLPNLTF